MTFLIDSKIATCGKGRILTNPDEAALDLGASRTVYPAGSRISSFTIISLLGRGGHGSVYLAEEITPGGGNRQVALKTLQMEFADSDLRERFEIESETLARLEHPHILKLYDHGISSAFSPDQSVLLEEEVYWFSAQYFPDKDAGHGLDNKHKFGPARVGRLLLQIGSALDEAHGYGIIHRDVKPRNILLENRAKPNECAVLADFGVAKWVNQDRELTVTNIPVGTTRYSSPEQLDKRHRVLDGRSDQFSLACTAFELLTGEPLYQGRSHKERNKPIPNISERRKGTPTALDIIFKKALSHDIEGRYSSCMEFALEFQSALATAKGPVKPPPGPTWNVVKRNKMIAAVSMVALSTIVAIPAIVLSSGEKESIASESYQAEIDLPDWKDPAFNSDQPIEVVTETKLPGKIYTAELAVDFQGNLYAAANGAMKKISSDVSGNTFETSISFDNPTYLTGLSVNESGEVFTFDKISKRMYKWQPDSGDVGQSIINIDGAKALVQSGNLYFRPVEDGAVCKLQGFGSVFPIEVDRSGEFCFPVVSNLLNYTVSAEGTLYIATEGAYDSSAIQWISKGDDNHQSWSIPQLKVYDLTATSSGVVYFTAVGDNRIFRISPDSPYAQVVYSFPENIRPRAIAVGENGNLYTMVGNAIWRVFDHLR
ncbi:serine/threonine-protein kinase (plasmid) [Rhodococcus pyridinivorans]|uniref:serine/threonine-protein kinase n=1 Tax=Rhodococcus pyridinivorans TaxID=103816 RepID=UPI002164DDF1|nr:serine/threonine-protein kinase [Rhodococcus pyridinivorans]UVT27719.1 serine/threonine-protein kinase [Rhodococcus pyridinivorans]